MGSGMCVFLEERVGSMAQWDEVPISYKCIHLWRWQPHCAVHQTLTTNSHNCQTDIAPVLWKKTIFSVGVYVFQYCHYVAGLVGIGLSRLFSASELESEEVGRDHRLANSMGLFLQKTNIIRDYLEDVQQGRHFWPKEVTISLSHIALQLHCTEWSPLIVLEVYSWA